MEDDGKKSGFTNLGYFGVDLASKKEGSKKHRENPLRITSSDSQRQEDPCAQSYKYAKRSTEGVFKSSVESRILGFWIQSLEASKSQSFVSTHAVTKFGETFNFLSTLVL